MREKTIMFLYLIAAFMYAPVANADILPLNDALRATYTACVGIDDNLADLKKMAGINTAVTGVGTAVGAGATVVGLVKASKDKEVEVKLEKLREIEQRNPDVEASDDEWDTFSASMQTQLSAAKQEIEKYQAEIEKLTKQSKSLGNWRTGLLAGNTATNVAGAIIAGNNKVDDDLQTQIDNCKKAVDELQRSMMQARFDGEDVSEAQQIVTACKEYNYVDISPINKRAKGAMISSVVGATTGLAGTVTSAMANTDKTRNDNTDAGKQKEKNLNTASNVLAGASTVASATATVFNATQISAIKKVATVASKCTEVLK
ncbi:MAG: hypothetical protein IKV34_02025 [Clostridia bacterium]|nr:hypothetical protein [Clostridia bacterium]